LKDTITLRGKITIPATVPFESNGKVSQLPVVNIGGFSSSPDITHVFFEEGAKVRVIDTKAFNNTNLQYIDFIDSIRWICNDAFFNAALQVYTLPKNLNNIG
jgi:hypothetical protein